MSLVLAGKTAWVLMAVGWYILRYPFERRARRARVSVDRKKFADRVRLTISLTGLGVLPAIYVATGQPSFADYQPSWPLLALGILAAAASLVMFRLTHKALGRMWSVSLQLKEDHRLVTGGTYGRVRHPMYTAFWLMALAQALLLPNWVAGAAGVVGFGFLFFSRIGPEERLMEEAFGEEYRDYKARTKRVIPHIY
ncbi:protein-S-isoprenylcysteine O-methyltransferase [Mesorhizobium sp. BAC0120]|uniref:protein-S-isoprenylcysteine O-methyltransferase n=1 Tax=Mesorhizobium sp. BAC0120 TaxID=3090670 RepID=UPI00298CFD09|nr:protein-S-isoprenylcysteine O-methyltransferase [Mesorhizobium sp. BAC0120]MDW6022137.1 protein-S-isoprenylcysteine O-methyltransferase [Mesorhizobium sp. BAC0120]